MLAQGLRVSSGNFAMLAAMRRASSRVRKCAAERGKPVSHGCVRISPENAATLYALVAENGLENTQVVLTGATPGPSLRGRFGPGR